MVTPARVSDLVQTEFPTNIWVNGTWAEFVAIADAPENAKATCYYFKMPLLPCRKEIPSLI
jgi:hypothetical protein